MAEEERLAAVEEQERPAAENEIQPFQTAGFEMNEIVAAADGATPSAGGLTAEDVKSILEANGVSQEGKTATCRARLKGILLARAAVEAAE